VPLIASSLIVLTTIHAADFRDEEGDRLEGKKTMPISFPEGSRIVMLASLVVWSSALSVLWNLNAILASILQITGAVVGLRFMYRRNAAADRMSYRLYNVRPSRNPDDQAHTKVNPYRYGYHSRISAWV
jgi:4-hydroxybenzoate polyprenyltransferase